MCVCVFLRLDCSRAVSGGISCLHKYSWLVEFINVIFFYLVLLYGKVTLPHDTYLSYKRGSSLGSDIFGNSHIMCHV